MPVGCPRRSRRSSRTRYHCSATWDRRRRSPCSCRRCSCCSAKRTCTQKFFSARDERAARLAVVGWIVGTILVETLIDSIGIFGSLAVGGLGVAESEEIVIRVATDVLPPVLGVLLVCGARRDRGFHRQQLSADAVYQPDPGRLSALRQSRRYRPAGRALYPSDRGRGRCSRLYPPATSSLPSWRWRSGPTRCTARASPRRCSVRLLWKRATRAGGVASMLVGMLTTLVWEVVGLARAVDGNPTVPVRLADGVPGARPFHRDFVSSSVLQHRRRRMRRSSCGLPGHEGRSHRDLRAGPAAVRAGVADGLAAPGRRRRDLSRLVAAALRRKRGQGRPRCVSSPDAHRDPPGGTGDQESPAPQSCGAPLRIRPLCAP